MPIAICHANSLPFLNPEYALWWDSRQNSSCWLASRPNYQKAFVKASLPNKRLDVTFSRANVPILNAKVEWLCLLLPEIARATRHIATTILRFRRGSSSNLTRRRTPSAQGESSPKQRGNQPGMRIPHNSLSICMLGSPKKQESRPVRLESTGRRTLPTHRGGVNPGVPENSRRLVLPLIGTRENSVCNSRR